MTEPMQASLHHIRGSVILLSFRTLGILFLVNTTFALILAIALFSGLGSDYYEMIIILLWLLHTIKFILEAYIILYFLVPWATTVYYIADHHLIVNGGVMQVDEKVYELNKLREVDLVESWLGKLLNYGTLHGTVSASGFSDEFTLVGVADAKKYERVLRSYVKEANK
jgi:uncharacterized membrane protein YdbT with pleckstrin-like domain